jgi:GT2 family glycosyltransferase
MDGDMSASQPDRHEPTRIVAATATFQRPAQLRALLNSLRTEPIAGMVIVDNGRDADTAKVAAEIPFPVEIVTPPTNLGCGPGVGLALQTALKLAATHVWLFDDDAFAQPGAGTELLAALDSGNADVAVPLITDRQNRIRWFPGPLDEPAWTAIREELTPEDFRARCGIGPWTWTWSPWTSLLVTRRAVERVGLPRTDFGFQGEDIEWTLRLTQHFRGVLTGAAECRHEPPDVDAAHGRAKHAAMLQNTAFTAIRLRHGRRILVHLPGNGWRFLRAARFSVGAFAMLGRAWWRGIVRGRPAGADR